MTNPDFIFGVTHGDIGYDIETYPNIFTFTAVHITTGVKWYFEISFRRNDLMSFCLFLEILAHHGCRMVGFNNIGFDYPVIHFIYRARRASINVIDIYDKAMSIINAPHNARFAHLVWESDWLVPQLDLYKIHHFDNQARATSLKVLEFNMRSNNIEDLPFDVGLHLDNDQSDVLSTYNLHDVNETNKFYNHTLDQIRFREELTEKYGKNFLNHNDTKIGKDFFIMKLEEHTPGCCYTYIDKKRHIQQTIRDQIKLADVVLPYVKFQHPEFQRILHWFNSQVITETKGSIKDVNCNINGFQFDFGTGGIHGSIESQIVYSNDQYIIEDWDVASYYPNLAIANGLHPAHLGMTFCKIYQEVYEQRKQHAKGTAENAMLKLALNGVYGDSNNKYSPFFDPQYTMSITINGQLLLCMLAEALMSSTDVQMIQINTDGLTIRYPRSIQSWVHHVAEWWENLTKLELENVEYNRFIVRDVNNYIAEYTDGSVKRKGAYEHDLGWHQNHSNLIVPKAAEAALIHGADIRDFIMNHDDDMDFLLRAKVPRKTVLEWGGKKVQNIVRYYISTQGEILEKIMPAAGVLGAYKRANKLTNEYYNSVVEQLAKSVDQADFMGVTDHLGELDQADFMGVTDHLGELDQADFMGVTDHLGELDAVGIPHDERIHTKNKSKYAERRTGINTGWTVMLCNNLDSYEFALMRECINYEWYIKEAEKLVKPLLD